MKSFTFTSLATVAVLALTANASTEFDLSSSQTFYTAASSIGAHAFAKRQDNSLNQSWCSTFKSVCPSAAVDVCGPGSQYLTQCDAEFDGDKCKNYSIVCACRAGPGAAPRSANAAALQKTFDLTSGACSELPTSEEPFIPEFPETSSSASTTTTSTTTTTTTTTTTSTTTTTTTTTTSPSTSTTVTVSSTVTPETTLTSSTITAFVSLNATTTASVTSTPAIATPAIQHAGASGFKVALTSVVLAAAGSLTAIYF